MVRRLKRRRGLRFWLILLVIVALIAGRFLTSLNEPAKPVAIASGVYRVERVIDGDTILLAGGARVRLIGVDTYELDATDERQQFWAREATQFAREFVGHGEVRLRLDRERLDHYGRFLAYVYVDDTMLNEALLRHGLARAVTNFNYSSRFKRIFRRVEDEARNGRRGIWSVKE